MNKKILMSGIAALLIGGSMHATSVSASALSVSMSGEASLTATFEDTCRAKASDLETNASFETLGEDGLHGGTEANADTAGVRGALADFLLMTYTPTAAADALDQNGVNVVADTDQFLTALNAINGLTNTFDTGVDDSSLDANVTFAANPCGTTNPSADNPVWATKSKLEWSASGTLANGLGITIGGGAGPEELGDAITLSGAFGSLSWENGGDSAVKRAHVGGDGDIDVAGSGFLGHALGTAGTAGYVIGWQTPSVGGMDIHVTYAPSSDNNATNEDEYLDTLAVGAAFSTEMLKLSAGWETATHNANASGNSTSKACDHGALTGITAGFGGAAEDIIDDVLVQMSAVTKH